MQAVDSSKAVILYEPARAWLNGRAANETSQFGEDGLIAACLEHFGEISRWCFEVGAADGVTLSNTKRLRDKGWHSILVESDPERFEILRKLKSETVCCVHADILQTPLDAIFHRHTLGEVQFDLGIIDIDGQDYYVWEDLKAQPRLMLVEYNVASLHEMPERGATKGQAGLLPILELGERKGYVALAQTVCNVLFARKDLLAGARAQEFHGADAHRLNIGSGEIRLPGFECVDRCIGTEAFPLKHADNSIDEIRASHILEHFTYLDAKAALAEWFRVLKPGSIMRIAVPDAVKIVAAKDDDPLWRFYLSGGQKFPDDIHHSVWDEKTLRAFLSDAGFVNIVPWAGDKRDASGMAISLNLECNKPKLPLPDSLAGGLRCEAIHKYNEAMPESFIRELPEPNKKRAKICAVMSCPRLGWNDMWGEMWQALSLNGIPFRRFTGAFWDQCIQNVLEDLIAEGHDIALTVDYDSVFTAAQVKTLLEHCLADKDIDALAAVQVKRNCPYPLFTNGMKSMQMPSQPFKARTAHFGLTVIRLDALKEIPKPWFLGKPDKQGTWRGDDRTDADIHFWRLWEEHGRALYIDPAVRIGHLEVMVSEFGEDWQARHVSVKDWRAAQKLAGKTE